MTESGYVAEKPAKDRVQALAEAEAEHLIGLVDHEHGQTGKIDRPFLHMLQQAARRGDDHMGALLEVLTLKAKWLSADQQKMTGPAVHADIVQRLFDLQRQLSGGDEDERLGQEGLEADLLQQRQRIRERLAASCPGLGDEALAC